MRRAAVIGDIHGKDDVLQSLIDNIRFKFGDEIDLYSVGDLIDRGEGSKNVIDICIRNNILGILGNHDVWLRELTVSGEFDDFALHAMMGGKSTLRSYGCTWDHAKYAEKIEREMKARIPRDHVSFLSSLPLWRSIDVEGQKYILTHAGLQTKFCEFYGSSQMSDEVLLSTISANNPQCLLWSFPDFHRSDCLMTLKTSTQIFGHSVVRDGPIDGGHFIAIDTGCGTAPPFTLTAVILPEREFVSVTHI